MSVSSPFSVDPPGRVDIASGWRAALILPDGTLVSRARVMWPLSAYELVRERGRVEVRVEVNGGPMRPLAAVPGSESFALVVPAAVGDTLRAEARFVNAAGQPSTWVGSLAHVVTDPLEGASFALYDSAVDGWVGQVQSAEQVIRNEPTMFVMDSWTDGFSGFLSSAQAKPDYSAVSTHLDDSMRTGWLGPLGYGATLQYDSLYYGWDGQIAGGAVLMDR